MPSEDLPAIETPPFNETELPGSAGTSGKEPNGATLEVVEIAVSGNVILMLSIGGDEGCEEDCCIPVDVDVDTTSPDVGGAVVVVTVGNTNAAVVEEGAGSLAVAAIVVEVSSTTDGFPSSGVLNLASAGSGMVVAVVVVVVVGVVLLSLPALDVAGGGCTAVADSAEPYFLVLLRMFLICLTNSSSC